MSGTSQCWLVVVLVQVPRGAFGGRGTAGTSLQCRALFAMLYAVNLLILGPRELGSWPFLPVCGGAGGAEVQAQTVPATTPLPRVSELPSVARFQT